MSKDQMNNVFPVLFSFVKGEAPTAQKLTGAVKRVDIAFSNLTQAIGDPWDYQSHSFSLSTEKLGITSLARLIGPVDYVSPLGGSFNQEGASTYTVLGKGKNFWNLGYPLIKVTADAGEESGSGGTYSKLAWGTDITLGSSDPSGIFTTEVASLDLVDGLGDFYIDYYKGTITSYGTTTVDIQLDIDNLFFFGAGIPWGTHNIIPTWNESVNLCSVIHVGDTATLSTWTVTLPTVTSSPRVSTIGQDIGGTTTNPDSEWQRSIPGYGSYHRLPRSITSAGLSPGDPIPEGYFLLWEDFPGRIVQNVLFYYRDNTSLTITTPYSATGYISAGTNYRILTSGTSLSEAVSYLLSTQRYNKHAGFGGNENESYTTPISHNDLTNLYNGDLSDLGSLVQAAFRYRKSNYSNNPHPQYIHRAGFMANDYYGNTSNAMRGDLVFAGEYDSTNGYACAGGTTASGNLINTYGIMWGGGTTTNFGNTKLSFEGGKDLTTWSSGTADRYAFGLVGVGGIPATSESNERFGALTINPWYGTPLYLRGYAASYPTGGEDYTGGVLGFDLGRNSEPNYLKLLPAIRSGSYDPYNMSANTGQTGFALRSYLMPSVSNRIAHEQVRELRFRGCSYVSTATNPTYGIGGSVTRASLSTISELQYYFTSPGVLGADFLNVYSNAIFFSDDGSGQTTSFTDMGETWLDESPTNYDTTNGYFSQNMPTGLYYMPYYASNPSSPTFAFSIYDTSTTNSTQPLLVGDRTGLHYLSTLGGDISFATQAGHVALIAGDSAYTYYLAGGLIDENVYIYTDEDINMRAYTSVSSYSTLNVNSSGSISAESTGNTEINAGGTLTLTGANQVYLTSTTSNITIDSTVGITSVTGSQVRMYTGSAPSFLYSDQILISSNSYTYVESRNNSVFITGADGAGLYAYPSGESWRSIRLMKTLPGTPGSKVDYIEMNVGNSSSATTYSKMILNGNASSASSIDVAGSFTISSVMNMLLSPTANISLVPTGTNSDVWLDTNTSGGDIVLRTDSSSENATKVYINITGTTITEGATLKIHEDGEIYFYNAP